MAERRNRTEYNKKRYKRNKEKELRQNKIWRRKNREHLRKYDKRRNLEKYLEYKVIEFLFKGSEPCADCGKSYPTECMEWDHCHGKRGKYVAQYFQSPYNCQREVEKCDLVCGNCHNIRTEKRRNTWISHLM
jgi:hypothetical protein